LGQRLGAWDATFEGRRSASARNLPSPDSGVVERAWDEWRRIAAFMVDQRIGPVLYSRTIANFVFDAIARNAIAEFGSDDSVHVKIEAQTVKFVFKGAVLARFKKGDENKLGQNVPTQAAIDFIDAQGIFPRNREGGVYLAT
jgi:hypothetical protein